MPDNTDRAFGTILGSEITRNKGTSWRIPISELSRAQADRASVHLFRKVLTLELTGDSNDYFGKGFPVVS